MHRRTITHAAAPLLALAAAVIPTAAHAADNSRGTLSWAPEEEVVAVCADGSEIGLGFDLVRNVHVRTDRTGEVVSETRNVNYTGIFENLGTGERYTFQGTRVVTFDFVRGEFVSRGNYRTVTMPGAGVVLHTAGIRVDDLDVEELILHQAGPTLDEWAPGGEAAVCSLFGLQP